VHHLPDPGGRRVPGCAAVPHGAARAGPLPAHRGHRQPAEPVMLYLQSITIIRPAEVEDRYHNVRLDYGAAATRIPVSGVNVQPAGGSTEDTDDRQVTVTGWRLYTPRGMDLDLRETDGVEAWGTTMQVVGKVARWPAPGGGVHHVEADLREVA